MKKTVTKFLILSVILGLIPIYKKAQAAPNITVTGSWSEIIDASDLQAGPGSDLINSYESASNAISIEITGTGQANWQVNVKKIDTDWPSSFYLYVKRTSDGIGGGSISRGTFYQEVTETDKDFFEGQANRSDIHLQLKLGGVSVQIPPGTYTTTVYYTVIGY
ncbi:MAG: hypothetical protein AB1797_10785 [bacterium]